MINCIFTLIWVLKLMMKQDFLDSSWVIIPQEIFSCNHLHFDESDNLPKNYRNTWKDVKDFYDAYLLGKRWQSVSYWFIPKEIL